MVSCFSLLAGEARAQAQASPADTAQPPKAQQPGQPPPTAQQERAAEQLKRQEHQRILGVFPNFNTSYISDAVALTPKQKLQLVLRSGVDPVTFAVAAADAGISQWEDDYPGYHQGAEGYFKRWGASYADSFDGALWGNAIFPILLHQDPRYFRKGTGPKKERLWYAIESTVRARGDNGKWQPNYSNVLGNIASGGIANLYYPSTDRGIGLTFERAFTVTAEGVIGSLVVEFWPDISRHLRHKQ